MRAFWSEWTLFRFLIPVMLLSGCAASALNNGVFRDGDVQFAVGPIPGTWNSVTAATHDDGLPSFGFRDDTAGVTVGGTGRCGRDGDDVPLQSLTQHLSIGFTDRATTSEREFMLDGRSALRTELTAALDGVPVRLVLVVIKKDACVYDFWWIAPPSVTDTRDFDRFVQGFRTLS
jgi:hypothetical protein